MNSLISRGGLLDEMFRDVAPGFYVRPLRGEPLPGAAGIKLDVRENDDGYTLYADVPGAQKSDIHVSVDGNVVSLNAEIRPQEGDKTDKVLRNERLMGSVSRSVQLPVDIDEARSSAKYENGVLLLTLPKKPHGSGARRLAVS